MHSSSKWVDSMENSQNKTGELLWSTKSNPNPKSGAGTVKFVWKRPFLYWFPKHRLNIHMGGLLNKYARVCKYMYESIFK